LASWLQHTATRQYSVLTTREKLDSWFYTKKIKQEGDAVKMQSGGKWQIKQWMQNVFLVLLVISY